MWMVNDIVERRGTSGSEKVLNGSTYAEPGNRGNHKTNNAVSVKLTKNQLL